jgi:hypothetical protein
MCFLLGTNRILVKVGGFKRAYWHNGSLVINQFGEHGMK